MNITNTKTIKNSRSYSHNFQQKIIDSNIYPDRYKYSDNRVPPKSDNLKEMDEILIQSRFFLLLLQFSNKNFEEFQEANIYISKKNKAIKIMILIIKDKIKNGRYIEKDILFINLKFLTNNIFTVTKPDLYYSICFE